MLDKQHINVREHRYDMFSLILISPHLSPSIIIEEQESLERLVSIVIFHFVVDVVVG
jgi:hypothetical protein